MQRRNWIYYLLAFGLILAACQIPNTQVKTSDNTTDLEKSPSSSGPHKSGFIKDISFPPGFDGNIKALKENKFSTKHLGSVQGGSQGQDFLYFSASADYGGSSGWGKQFENFNLGDPDYNSFAYLLHASTDRRFWKRDAQTNLNYPEFIIGSVSMSKLELRHNGEERFERFWGFRGIFSPSGPPNDKGYYSYTHNPALSSTYNTQTYSVNFSAPYNSPDPGCYPYYDFHIETLHPEFAQMTIIPPESPNENYAKVRLEYKIDRDVSVAILPWICTQNHLQTRRVKFNLDTTFLVPWTVHQYSCQKSVTDSSPWFYDELSQVPTAFSLDTNGVCQKCSAYQKRDPNNMGQCINACPPGQTSTNYGQTCVPGTNPIPTPIPTPIPSGSGGQSAVCTPNGNGVNCFTCPRDQYVVFDAQGKPVSCSGNVRTSDSYQAFGADAPFKAMHVTSTESCEAGEQP